MKKKRITPKMILEEHQKGWALYYHRKIANLQFKEFDAPFYRFRIDWTDVPEEERADIIYKLKEGSDSQIDYAFLENKEGDRVHFEKIIFMSDGDQVSFRDYRANSHSRPLLRKINFFIDHINNFFSKL